MRQVSGARVPPCLPSIDLRDDPEQRHLRRADVAVQRIRDADQPVVVKIGAPERSVHVFESRRKSIGVQ